MIACILGNHHCWSEFSIYVAVVKHHWCLVLQTAMTPPVIVVLHELTNAFVGFGVGLELMAGQAVAFQD